MNIIRKQDVWDPFELMNDFHHEINRLFHRSLHKKNGWEKTFEPEIDVTDEKNSFMVKADLPGVRKEDLDIKLEGSVLTLKGEKKEEKEIKEKNCYTSERMYGSFMRMIELPMPVKADQVKASYKDGVLEIFLPKAEGAGTKQITVEVK